MQKRRLKKQDIRKDLVREFLVKAFIEIETSLETHLKYYLIGFFVLVGAVTISYFFFQHLENKNERVSFMISKILEIADAPTIDKNDPKIKQYKDSGTKYFTNKEEKESELKKNIDEFLSLNPSKDQKCAINLLRAREEVRKGNFEEAIKIASDVAKNSKYKGFALHLLAQIYESKKDFEKAENTYKEISKLNTVDFPEPLGLTILADFYERQMRKKDALKTYEEALKILEKNKDKEATTPPPTLMLKAQMPQSDFASTIKQRMNEIVSNAN